MAGGPAHAAIQGFVGPWAPTTVNGFENATQNNGTFTTGVNSAGDTLTSDIANAGDVGHASFFLQNYGYAQTPAILLPQGNVSYDFTITLFSPTGFVQEFDDFGNGSSSYSSGDVISGSVNFNYAGGYFGYFGVNIDDGRGTASATVVLTQFAGPSAIPEPASLLLLATAGAGILVARRRS